MRKITTILLGLLLSYTSHSQLLTENFDDISILPGGGWDFINVSTNVGLTDWFQGNDAVFTSQTGAITAYVAANFNNTTLSSIISNWMILPVLSLNNGDKIKFYTRTTTGSTFPDRLEVRLSDLGAGSTTPANDTDVGSYINLLLTINPSLIVGGYPDVWTLQTITVSGLTGTTNSRIAFRYFVTDGGPDGINSDYIGIDELEVSSPPLGAKEFELTSLKYYYNKDTKTLSLESQSPLNSISIYNLLGQKVLAKNLTNNHHNVNLPYIQTGVYLAKIKGDNNTSKIIKLRIN